MKARRINIGAIAFLIALVMVVAYCLACVAIEKRDLKEICSLCEKELGTEVRTGDFWKASFYKNEFRGQLDNGKTVIAEKSGGEWKIKEIGYNIYTG